MAARGIQSSIAKLIAWSAGPWFTSVFDGYYGGHGAGWGYGYYGRGWRYGGHAGT